jgi:hypothetical protein
VVPVGTYSALGKGESYSGGKGADGLVAVMLRLVAVGTGEGVGGLVPGNWAQADNVITSDILALTARILFVFIEKTSPTLVINVQSP